MNLIAIQGSSLMAFNFLGMRMFVLGAEVYFKTGITSESLNDWSHIHAEGIATVTPAHLATGAH